MINLDTMIKPLQKYLNLFKKLWEEKKNLLSDCHDVRKIYCFSYNQGSLFVKYSLWN